MDGLVLAHAGEGATWQALLTLMALGIIVVLVLAVIGKLRLATPGDLILPLAAVAVLASLSGAASETLSDWVWWAFPIGVVLLVAIVLAAVSPLTLGVNSPLLYAAAVLAGLGVLLFDDPITRAWHPPPIEVAFAKYTPEDLTITLVSPLEDETVDAGDLDVVVEVTGGTIGDAPERDDLPETASLTDPEERGFVQVFLDGEAMFDPAGGPLRPVEDCEAGCTTATYRIPDVEPGTHRIIVEFKARDRNVFSPAQFRQVRVEVE